MDIARTTDSTIKGNLRKLWLRSKERNEALKQQSYTCNRCGVKASKAKGKEQKVEVHHKEGVLNWDVLIREIRAYLLTTPDNLEVLCPECHKKETYAS